MKLEKVYIIYKFNLFIIIIYKFYKVTNSLFEIRYKKINSFSSYHVETDVKYLVTINVEKMKGVKR